LNQFNGFCYENGISDKINANGIVEEFVSKKQNLFVKIAFFVPIKKVPI